MTPHPQKGKILPLVGLFFATAAVSLGFSRVGHESIAELAYQSPQLSAAAHDAIANLLQTSDPSNPQPGSVTDAAEWPDEIKSPYGAYHTEPWAVSFIQAHPTSHLWHFVNFPLGAKAYDPAQTQYATSTDIVHAVQGCIAILEGTGSFDQLTKLDALRYLLHLVGDAHQPLHTITGFFDVSDPQHPKLIVAPAPIPAGAWKDAGGNGLFYTSDGKTELHGAWDETIVNDIAGPKTPDLVGALTAQVDATKFVTPGDYHDWIKAWVSDSMNVAQTAYAGITYGPTIPGSSGQPPKGIQITLPANYLKNQVPTAQTQILKGATHLLQLLNAIHWAS